MKKLIFIILASFFILVFNSCDDEPNEIYGELYTQIFGQWEILSVHVVGYWGNELLHDDYFHISDSANHDSYEKFMHFREDGKVIIELFFEGILVKSESILSWNIEDNELKFKYRGFPYETKTAIYKFTKSELHFRASIEWQADSLMYEMFEYKLKR